MSQKEINLQKPKVRIKSKNTSGSVKDIANLRRTYVIKFIDSMKVSSSGKVFNIRKLQVKDISR